MNIHTMMANAAADVRAMELRIVHLQDEVKRTNEDNERLRQENAAITAARMHAEADLVHYQNVFVASVCVEAGSICREFFNLTQEKVRERAEGAIQKYVEERVNKEREDKQKEDMKDYLGDDSRKESEYQYPVEESRDFEEFDKSITAPTIKHTEIQNTDTSTQANTEYVQAPEGLFPRQVKNYYQNRLGYIPEGWKDRPIIHKDKIPSFLIETKKEEPPTTLRALIATVGF